MGHIKKSIILFLDLWLLRSRSRGSNKKTRLTTGAQGIAGLRASPCCSLSIVLTFRKSRLSLSLRRLRVSQVRIDTDPSQQNQLAKLIYLEINKTLSCSRMNLIRTHHRPSNVDVTMLQQYRQKSILSYITVNLRSASMLFNTEAIVIHSMALSRTTEQAKSICCQTRKSKLRSRTHCYYELDPCMQRPSEQDFGEEIANRQNSQSSANLA